jgi:DNA-binding NtrC family response regulator
MPHTVLVVEDDEILRMLIADALAVLDAQVIECACADEALSVLERSEPINLVLTDIRMPGPMDGVQLANMIYQRWPQLPVILTSGNLNMVEGLLPAQATFIAKPWSLDVLHETVRDFLHKGSAGGPSHLKARSSQKGS